MNSTDLDDVGLVEYFEGVLPMRRMSIRDGKHLRSRFSLSSLTLDSDQTHGGVASLSQDVTKFEIVDRLSDNDSDALRRSRSRQDRSLEQSCGRSCHTGRQAPIRGRSRTGGDVLG